jgi:zinc protease
MTALAPPTPLTGIGCQSRLRGGVEAWLVEDYAIPSCALNSLSRATPRRIDQQPAPPRSFGLLGKGAGALRTPGFFAPSRDAIEMSFSADATF